MFFSYELYVEKHDWPLVRQGSVLLPLEFARAYIREDLL